jgi:hypothetical protein
MKFLFFICLGIVSLFSRAQSLVLTQSAYEPVIGDSSFYSLLDTSAFQSGLPVAMSGSNVVWDFTKLLSTFAKANSVYVDPLSVPGASAFPSATMVQKQGTLFNYFKSVTSPTAQTEMLGINSSTLNLTFTNTAILAKFPVSYGNSFTDNVSGSYNFSISGTFNGTVSTHADGSGTLQLPWGLTLNNVLRVKSVQTIYLNYGIFPFATARQTVYNYFHSSQKFPVINITYSSLSVTGSSTPSVSAIVTGNSKSISVGMDEVDRQLSLLQLYPNPTQDVVFIDANGLYGDVFVEIFDAEGVALFSSTRVMNGNSIETVSLEELPNGFYFVKIQSGEQSMLKKFIVQR